MVSYELMVLAEYVRISKYRFRVFKVLGDSDVKIPKQISRETGIRQNHISKVLRDLKDKDLIECINENVRKGRLYRLTSTGREVRRLLSPVSQRYLNRDGLIYDSQTGKYHNIDDTVNLLNRQEETVQEYYNIILS